MKAPAAETPATPSMQDMLWSVGGLVAWLRGWLAARRAARLADSFGGLPSTPSEASGEPQGER